ncbi:MAG: ATP-binding cassette domain-containing protein, partial [Ignavibacterium sp.]
LIPTKGEIKYFFNQRDDEKNHQKVQILFQNNGELINPFRSVESILSEAIQKAGKNAFVKSVDELLRILSLPESIKIQKGYTLSGGQQQRVALARILAVNPQLIILDEPFSAQDKESVDNLVSIIKKIRNDSGKTIICISHDIKVLKNISDRLAIMKDGKVVEIGDAHKIFSIPQNEFTKFLIKASELELTAEEVETFLKKYEQN